MKAFVLYNPVAGQRSIAADVDQVVEFLTQRGCQVAGVEQTRGPGDATTYARRAAALGCDALFAAGGDGTFSQVVTGLIGSETALAILPAGTGNVLARQLGLPVPGSLWPPYSLVSCAQMLMDGQVRRVDLGRISLAGGRVVHHCLCWSGVGFDAQVNLAVDQELERKHRLGILAFILAAFLTLRDYRGTAAIVRVDGRRVSRRLIMLVANNIQLYGAFFRMAPRAVLDDGLLDVYCFRGRGATETLLHTLRLLVLAHLQDPRVDFYRARRVEIRTARPLPVHVDGESIGYTPVVIETLPRAVNLVVPQVAPASLFVDGGQPAASSLETPWQRIVRLAREASPALKDKNGTA